MSDKECWADLVEAEEWTTVQQRQQQNATSNSLFISCRGCSRTQDNTTMTWHEPSDQYAHFEPLCTFCSQSRQQTSTNSAPTLPQQEFFWIKCDSCGTSKNLGMACVGPSLYKVRCKPCKKTQPQFQSPPRAPPPTPEIKKSKPSPLKKSESQPKPTNMFSFLTDIVEE